MAQVPTSTKALVLGEKGTKDLGNGKTIPYYDAAVEERELQKPREGDVVVKVATAGFNHRELWIRKGQYPGIKSGTVLGADAAGTVIAGPSDLLDKRVFVVPMVGWESAVRAPEKQFGIVGGTNYPLFGTLAEYLVLPRDSVIPVPEHMTDEEAGAWGLGAVTAWRAVVTKAQIEKGDNVLITGIGGGVALIALLFCVARGATVFVSSSNPETIAHAVKLGAKGGINYRDESWPKDLGTLIKEHGANGLDAVVDSAGGDLLGKTNRLLNPGAKIVCYGMTASPSIPFTMSQVLKNAELLGSTMGSTAELRAATQFAAEHNIRPIVSTVLEGLENAEKGFELLASGKELGKIVVRVDGKSSGSKL
ncbi:NAD(P)-binding protein [Ceratobasidium sp. AG-I]|nr:NAD(P)-binding protein [Ceratobasidium sp. AG-I]